MICTFNRDIARHEREIEKEERHERGVQTIIDQFMVFATGQDLADDLSDFPAVEVEICGLLMALMNATPEREAVITQNIKSVIRVLVRAATKQKIAKGQI